jgi:hypothetical protein
VIKALDSAAFLSDTEYRRLPGRDQWVEQLARGKESALFAIIITLLPNLEILHVQPNTSPDIVARGVLPYLPQVVRFAATQQAPPYLTHLKEFQFNPSGYGADIDGANVDCFLYIPTLREFTAFGFFLENLGSSRPALSSNIESLSVSDEVAPLVWRLLFSSTSKLKKLTYTRLNRWSENADFYDLRPSALAFSLHLVRDTLEAFCMTACLLRSDQSDILGSLHDFPRLKKISIQASLLLGTKETNAESSLLLSLPISLARKSPALDKPSQRTGRLPRGGSKRCRGPAHRGGKGKEEPFPAFERSHA